MSSVKRNLIANYLGSAWIALMGLVFVPYYIRLMGVEAYGIVGVFASLQAIFAVLDLGLSHTLSREMARLCVNHRNTDLMADTARTLEVIYWVFALSVAAIVALLAYFISYHWLNPVQLSRESLLEALLVMALVIGLRWPVALYMGGLNGLQRQTLVNVLLGVFVTLQGAGALAVLWFIEPTIRAFFLWQALIALLQVVAFRGALWHSISSTSSGAFRKEVLAGLWRFAAGMSGISILTTILTQLDKVILSRLLSLSEFGYYTFAATVAGVLYRLIGPVFTAYYPRLTALLSTGDNTVLRRTYHQGSQLMAAVVLPVAIILAFFSRDILELWARDPEIVDRTHLLVSLLAIGNAFNGLMNMPYALQLAHGWTSLAFYSNTIAVIVLIPAIYFAVLHAGAAGAAVVWLVLNSAYLLVSIQFMHRRLLISEKWSWYINDIGKPMLVTLIIAAIGRAIITNGLPEMQATFSLVTIFCLAMAGAIGSSGFLRHSLLRQFSRSH